MSTVILVSGHDKYQRCWYSFGQAMYRYWKDCPWAIKFITNYGDCPLGEGILIGDDNGWGDAMLKALNTFNATSLLFMTEDYWLTAPPDTKSLLDFAKIVNTGGADYIKLNPSPDANIVDPYDDRLLEFKPDAQYRTSMQIAFWNKELLTKILKPTDTIWQFETEGGKRLPPNSKFYAVKEFKYIHYIHPDDPMFKWTCSGAMAQGRFTEDAFKWADKEGIGL